LLKEGYGLDTIFSQQHRGVRCSSAALVVADYGVVVRHQNDASTGD